MFIFLLFLPNKTHCPSFFISTFLSHHCPFVVSQTQHETPHDKSNLKQKTTRCIVIIYPTFIPYFRPLVLHIFHGSNEEIKHIFISGSDFFGSTHSIEVPRFTHRNITHGVLFPPFIQRLPAHLFLHDDKITIVKQQKRP